MTIPMPEPVAYAIFAENGNIRLWSNEPRDLPDLDSLGHMHHLITTTQAEAYADARVEAALRQVYLKLRQIEKDLFITGSHVSGPQAASFAANQVLAMLPKEAKS